MITYSLMDNIYLIVIRYSDMYYIWEIILINISLVIVNGIYGILMLKMVIINVLIGLLSNS